MSADNWTQCPKCVAQADIDKAKAINDLAASYGKIPAADFLMRTAEVDAMPNGADIKSSFPEYHDIGLTPGGEFYASFRATCRNCGWSFEWEHSQRVV